MSKRYSEKDKLRLLSGLAESSESRASYAKRHGVSVGRSRFDGPTSVISGEHLAAREHCGMRKKNQLAKDRAAVLWLLERSGQSVAEFCQDQGLPYGVVSRWCHGPESTRQRG